jgi:putative ABC transport system ATP-binding protein
VRKDKNMQNLSVENVELAYTDGEKTTYALKGVSLELPPNRYYGIMGPSGSGKSSLLYVLSGLKRPTAGTARFGDFIYQKHTEAAVTQLRRQKFGFVFQQHFLLSYLTALENIVVAGVSDTKETRNKAQELLESLGLGNMSHKYPGQLSGGEKQRIAVARALINDPDILFADEPTASLDQTNGLLVIESMAKWRTRGTVVVVTHDPIMVESADTVITLRDGRRDIQS